jgi:hypothetical protein
VSSECAGRTNEHTILEGLGGTHEDRDAICDTCNHYFGEVLDPRLCALFRPVLHQLAPIIAGKLKDTVVLAVTAKNRVHVRMEAGGVIEMRRVAHITVDGKTTTYGPRAILEQMARGSGRPDLEITEEPLGESLGDDVPEAILKVEDAIRHAAAKVLLVCLDFQARRHRVKPLSRAKGLRALRTFVRTVAPLDYMKRNGHHFAFDAGDLFDRAFGVSADSGFWNRTVISYDAPKRTLVMLLQIASTMPVGVVVSEVDLGTESFSFLSSKNLVEKGPVKYARKARSVLDVDAVRRSAFSTATADAIMFGFRKLMESHEQVFGRAVVEVDARSDSELLESLEVYGRTRVTTRRLNTRAAVVASIVEMLKLRFRANGMTDDDWRDVEIRAAARIVTLKDPTRVRRGLKQKRGFGAWRGPVLAAFRAESARLAGRFGYPKVLYPLSSSIVPL